MVDSRFRVAIFLLGSLFPTVATSCFAQKYFAHDAVKDQYGVIAPWYQGQNGQFDLRVRIAAETMKRYPWTSADKAIAVVPEYVLNGTWNITPNGVISIPTLSDWANGDWGQMAAREMDALVSYYRYSGDPWALATLKPIADTMLDHCVTAKDAAWPDFLISVPVTGKPYGNCDSKGWIQLDIAGEAAVALLHAYEATGENRWLEATEHWGDVLAEKRNSQPGAAPWGRYANPQDVKWGMGEAENTQAGGIVYELTFLDELIRLGYKGQNDVIVQARDQAREYLRDHLLPQWTVNETYGRNYWDWPDPVQSQTTTDWMSRYLLTNKSYFPNWKNDVRNMLSIYLNHTTVNPKSVGGIYSGAWALPESSGCCRTSLAWAPVELAGDFAHYAAEADSPWGHEIARRMLILGTYDFHTNGVVEDNISGGTIEAGGWFIAAHPSMLEWTLQAIGWLPDITGPARENHILRSTAVVNHVDYSVGAISYSTFDAPPKTIDMLRLAFKPETITSDGQSLNEVSDLGANGFSLKALESGDYIATIRHDGLKEIVIKGKDPQVLVSGEQLKWSGAWANASGTSNPASTIRKSKASGASVTCVFRGNQVRVLGDVGPDGGSADVFLDGTKQLAGIDFWNPRVLQHQIIYFNNGLADGQHTLKIVARAPGNPNSQGHDVAVEAFEYSSATGVNPSGAGGGPTDEQRLIFGYPRSQDYVDMDGNSWHPGMEFVARTGSITDSVAKTWWTTPQVTFVEGTKSPELYRYGLHWPEFVVNLTTGPGKYHVRIHLAETQFTAANQRSISIAINGDTKAERMDVFATAGAPHKAVVLVYNNIEPKDGVIAIRFKGETLHGCPSEALVQAIEIGPGQAEAGATPNATTE
jgi:hypothetical protein